MQHPNLVIYRLSAMGDVSMIGPVVLALKEQHPEAAITIVSNAFFEPIFAPVAGITFIGINTKTSHKGLPGILKICWQVYQLKPTHFADLHNSLRSIIIRSLLTIVGVKCSTIDKGKKEKKALIKHKATTFAPLMHTIQRYAQIFNRLGIPLNVGNAHFLPKSALPAPYHTTLQPYDTLIGVAPFAKHAAKTYPLAAMAHVVARLAQNTAHAILLFGSKQEREALIQLKAQFENVIIVTSNFGDELALISNLHVMLSMDSGNGHLAANYGVPVITIWAGTHPYAGFSPYAQPIEHSIIPDLTLFPGLPNSIFGNKMSEEVTRAFEAIAPETVAEKVLAQLR